MAQLRARPPLDTFMIPILERLESNRLHLTVYESVGVNLATPPRYLQLETFNALDKFVPYLIIRNIPAHDSELSERIC